nr:reverse transcriptase domain-containing protein [Tanacetum cinerariifolium]
GTMQTAEMKFPNSIRPKIPLKVFLFTIREKLREPIGVRGCATWDLDRVTWGGRDKGVGAARRWLEKEPPRSITTWDDLISKFINEFFPPSRTTNLRNEILNFQQKLDESFHEAWERYKDLLRACPHHGFTELHQLDTFYNALNPADQDSLNPAASGNLLEKSPQDTLTIIENKSKSISKTSVVTTTMTAMLKQFQSNPPLAQVKAVEEICVTCGGAHPYYQCLATSGNTFLEYRNNIQGYVSAATATMTDDRTMAKMLRAPTEGCAEAIVVPPILAEQFELKHSLINMMPSKQFFGLEKDNPHDHGQPAGGLKKNPRVQSPLGMI